VRDRFWSRVEKIPFHTCWEWTGARASHGYGIFHLSPKMLGGTSSYTLAHRASWILKHGVIARGLFVLHKCDNRSCVNPEHLYLGTDADNSRDTRSRGRSKIGGITLPGDRGFKLTSEQVLKMHRRLVSGEKGAALAREFGLDPTTVSAIKLGKSWNWLTQAKEVA